MLKQIGITDNKEIQKFTKCYSYCDIKLNEGINDDIKEYDAFIK